MPDRFEQCAVQTHGGRRSFLQKLAFAGALFGAARQRAGAQTVTAYTDAEILNFLLNLEYLQAEAYLFATTGKGIAQFVDQYAPNSPTDTTGGHIVTFTNPTVQALATEIGLNEASHISLIRTTMTGLGGQPIDKPPINLTAFGGGFGSQAEFLTLVRSLEDIGVTAYNGAMAILPSKTVMGVVARILATEGQHTGDIRYLMGQHGLPCNQLDGVDIVPPSSGSQSISANSKGLSGIRAPGEVLALLYGASNATSGGFFPSGVNGVIKTSTQPAPADPDIRNQTLVKFTATPNPIVTSTGHGVTTLAWEAPGVTDVEIRVNTMNGGLLVRGGSYGKAQTGDWVTDGMMFYLQDVSGGKGLFPAYTLATLAVKLQRP